MILINRNDLSEYKTFKLLKFKFNPIGTINILFVNFVDRHMLHNSNFVYTSDLYLSIIKLNTLNSTNF